MSRAVTAKSRSRRRAAVNPQGTGPGCAASFRPARAVVATLSLLLFFLRITLAAPSLPQPAVDGYVNLIPICTGDGIKWIALDRNAPEPIKQASVHCPLCLAAHDVALLPTLDRAPRLIATTHGILPAFYRDAPVLRIAARPPPGRGPPTLSISEPLIRSL